MSKLYIVATPIGNLGDITLRALETLKSVDLIVAEDTRRTLKLLNYYQIKKPIISYHQHSRLQKLDYIIEKLSAGQNIALVCDAGTPGIADPGGFLIKKVIEELGDKVQIIPIPGPSAITAALSISGFPAQKFVFLGYFPKKKGRQTLLKDLKSEKRTVIFYESPYRIIKTLRDITENLGDVDIIICRELTKKFEEIFRGKSGEALKYFQQKLPKGEFTVIIKP